MPNGNNSENIENYNKNVQEYYAKLNELEREGEWDKIVDMVCAPIMIDPNTNSMEGRDDDLDDAFDLWAKQIYQKNEYGLPSGTIKKEKLRTFEELSKAIGRHRGKHAYKAGGDIENTKEQIKNGTLKGAEGFADDEQALEDIASSYVYEYNASVYNMNVGVNATFNFHCFTSVDSGRLFEEKVKEGINEFKQTLKDDKERQKVDVAFDCNSPNKCRKYGLEIKDKSFKETELKKQVVKLSEKELDEFEAMAVKTAELAAANKAVEESAKAEAQKGFDKISKGMVKKDQFGKNLGEMYFTLSRISNQEKDKGYESFSPSSLNRLLHRLHDSSEKYLVENELNPVLGRIWTEEQRNIDTTAEIRKYAVKIISGAKEDLEKLEKMTRKGHKDSGEYTRMRDALKSIADLDINKTSLETLQQKLGDLDTKASAYDKSHDKWNKAVRGDGKDRLDMSKHLKRMAQDSMFLLSDLPSVYNKRPLGTLPDALEAERKDRIELAKELVGKTEKMLRGLKKLSGLRNENSIKGADEVCRDDISVVSEERKKRIHFCIESAQRSIEKASGEKLREMCATIIYFTRVEMAAKKGKPFKLVETLNALSDGVKAIKDTAAFKELAKLPDEELRSLTAKNGGKQLTLKYMNKKIETAEMERQRKTTREMARKAGLGDGLSPKAKSPAAKLPKM